jgi:hypothetical protein
MLARSIDGLTLMRTTNMVTFSGICFGHTGLDCTWPGLHVAWTASGLDCIWPGLHLASAASGVGYIWSGLHLERLAGHPVASAAHAYRDPRLRSPKCTRHGRVGGSRLSA